MNHLAIELSESSVKFTSLRENIKVNEYSFEFYDRTENRYKEQLLQCLEDSGLKNQSFDEHSISWFSSKTSLVPMPIFAESNALDIFSLSFGADTPTSDIDYNRIPENNLVNVFEIPSWVKSFFVLRYPRAVIQHESTMILRQLFAGSMFQSKIVVIPHSQNFIVLMAYEGKFQFYSIFDYQSAEDIIYNLLFTLQQKDRVGQAADLLWCDGVGSNSNLLENFEALFVRVNDFKTIKLKKQQDFILNSHQFCVS
ncbi:MAG: DUF3822 family protein [Bacteroidota bacterium]